MVKLKLYDLSCDEEETVIMEFTETQFWCIYGALASQQENIKNIFKLVADYPKIKKIFDVPALIDNFNLLEEILRIFDVEVETEEDSD